MPVNLPGKLNKVVEVVVEEAVDSSYIDVKVGVDEHVAEAGDGSKSSCKCRRDDAEVDEAIDRGGVVRHVAAGARHEMRRYVQGVLSAQLQAALDRPQLLSLRGEPLEWVALVAAERLQSFVERQQVTADDCDIRSTWRHRPNSPRAMRAACTESILRTNGR